MIVHDSIRLGMLALVGGVSGGSPRGLSACLYVVCWLAHLFFWMFQICLLPFGAVVFPQYVHVFNIRRRHRIEPQEDYQPLLDSQVVDAPPRHLLRESDIW